MQDVIHEYIYGAADANTENEVDLYTSIIIRNQNYMSRVLCILKILPISRDSFSYLIFNFADACLIV